MEEGGDKVRLRTRVVSILVLTMALLPTVGGVAFAQLSTGDPGVTVVPDEGENCNGIVPTPGSENTVKRLVGGDLVPGGTAEFLIEYPLDPDDPADDQWEIVDCVLIGDGSGNIGIDVDGDGDADPGEKIFGELYKATFNGVSNIDFFTLTLNVEIPTDVPVGTTICNVAKTTEGPSAPQQSNRKAGPACFVVGGAARVEKQDPQGALLGGAVFHIECVNAALDPSVQPLFISPEPDAEGLVTATDGFISINGAAGSTCTVTEVQAPAGYTLPPVEDATKVVTIPVGVDETQTIVFVDQPIEPGIAVTKSCLPTSVALGQDVTYTITIENTGTEMLEDITVMDSLLGDISSSFPDTLAVGASVTEEFVRTVTENDPDPLPNEVTASAVGAETQGEVSDSDACESDVLHEPGIDVSKTCLGTANVGDEVTYLITVTNTGNEPLTDVTVSDSLLGDISDLFSDTLGVGDSEQVEVTRVVEPGDGDILTNEVTASGIGADSQESVEDSASCETTILRPAIDIVKDGPSLAHVGDEITYTLTVTNIGNTPLHNVVVSDPLCDAAPVLTGGDDGDGILQLDETWTLSCTHVVAEADGDPVPNTATVVGEDSLETQVEASDDHVVDIISPAIAIVKTSDVLIASPDQEVTYTMVVTNTGDTPLANVTLSDPLCGSVEFVDGDVNEDGLLDLTESWTYTCSAILFEPVPLGTAVAPVTNTATVQGTDVLGLTVAADDSVTVTPVLAEPPQTMPKTGSSGIGSMASVGGLLLVTGFVLSVGSRRRFSPLAVLGAGGSPMGTFVASQVSAGWMRARMLRRLATRLNRSTGRPPPRGP